MIELHYNKIRAAALILLSIPAYIFFLGWLKPIISCVFVFLLFAALVRAIQVEDRVIKVKASTLIVLAVLILLWAFLSGQGGFFTQKTDYTIRNVIFRDLINLDWPVRYNEPGDVSLVYYIGYWLLPALVGRLVAGFGGFAAGWLAARIAILLWTAVLIYVAFLLVLFRVGKGRRKAVYIAFAVFVLFSGMDAVGAITSPKNFLNHIEWWAAGTYQYSSMSTQLCWVFNQAVPAWLACAVAFNEKDEKSFAFIGLLLLPTSPLPLVGLAVYMLAFAVCDFVKSVKAKAVGKFFKNVFTVQNILAIVTLLPVFGAYYMNNAVTTDDAGGGTPGVHIGFDSAVMAVVYVMFVLFEFGFLLLVLKNKKNRFESLVILCSLLAAPLITVGNASDFCMRASIPALFLLMLMMMEYLIPELTRKKENAPDKKSKEYQKHVQKLVSVILIFAIGSITPLVEYTSSARKYIQTNGESATMYDVMDSLTDIKEINGKANFVGTDSSDSLFYKYFAKK